MTTKLTLQAGATSSEYVFKGTDTRARAAIKKYASLKGIAVDGTPLTDAEGNIIPATPMTAKEIGDAILALWVEDIKRTNVEAELRLASETAREAARAQSAAENDL